MEKKNDDKTRQDFLHMSIEKRRHLFARNLALGKFDVKDGGGESRGKTQMTYHNTTMTTSSSGSFQNPPDRRLTILSPHSANCTPDLLQFGQFKETNRKSLTLPKLLLPNTNECNVIR